MIGRFLRTHSAFYTDRRKVFRAATGEECGLSSPWLILGVGAAVLAALDLWLFGGVPLFDDTITPWLPWNILAPQVVIWLANVALIIIVMAALGAHARPMVVARLWAYLMGHVATVMPPALLALLGIRSALFGSTAIEAPAALLFGVISILVLLWLGAGLRAVGGRRTYAPIAAVLIALAAAVAIMETKRHYVSRFYDIRSGSMRPAFDRGDRILANRIMLAIRDPRRGDVVVYDVERERSGRTESFVHRIVGVPGDRVAFVECGVLVNGRPAKAADPLRSEVIGIRAPIWVMPESLGEKSYLTTFDSALDPLCQRDEVTVPAGHYFVAGDARDRSLDSRFPSPGLVPRAAITGIASAVYTSARPSRRL